MEKITITRALSELKLLNERLEKKINNFIAVDLSSKKFGDKALQSNKVIKDFEKEVKSDYQSINDLIERRTKIKSAIIKSNAVQRVTLEDSTLTVAEAIEQKNLLPYKINLLNSLKKQRMEINKIIENNRISLDEQVNSMLLANAGTDKKKNPDEYDSIAKPFIDHNKNEIVDPIDINKSISELENEIEIFRSNIDIVLSESNSKTEIEI
jgi:hypothetical protein